MKNFKRKVKLDLSSLAFWAKALKLAEFSTANFFLCSNRLWSDSPSGLLAMAFTAVKGIAENTRTPANWMKSYSSNQKPCLKSIKLSPHLLPWSFAHWKPLLLGVGMKGFLWLLRPPWTGNGNTNTTQTHSMTRHHHSPHFCTTKLRGPSLKSEGWTYLGLGIDSDYTSLLLKFKPTHMYRLRHLLLPRLLFKGPGPAKII